MNILILHRVPYPRIEYHRGIDHTLHDVTYFGKREIIASLPPDLRCTAVERPGKLSALEEARAWLTEHPQDFDRVISMSEYELLDAARLREWLGVEGAPVGQVMLARDKVLMKGAVARSGLRVPRFLPLSELIRQDGKAPWSGSTVLKPHSGASSVDVVVFDDPSKVHAAIAGKRTGVAELDRDGADLSLFEVEEFIDGPILHFDGLVEQGKILTLTASEYIGTCLEYARGLPIGSYQIELSEEMEAWVARALDAVDIHNGSFHLEAIVDRQGERVFLEVGNRVGGADVVPTFEMATGIHLPSQELRILLQDTVEGTLPAPPKDRRWFGWFAFPGHHLGGHLFMGFDGAGSFRGSSSAVTWHELSIGKPLPTNITYSAHEAPLAGIVGTSSPAETRRWIVRLFQSLRMRTASPHITRGGGDSSISKAPLGSS
ncbi:acetyl-CoA carboxylase biotin carboxylase subunit family protein [Pendulispora albinea]|uniref:ATP-grasp domain-containing protein n=1 Tax=Pendulispora albinea TaxID=2741071 RepID=A0ABZ2LWN1_9BACT